MKRKVEIKFKDFPQKPNNWLKDTETNEYIKFIEIELFKLTAQYFIEEYGDNNITDTNLYPALKYLKSNTNFFKFESGQPGISKDSRKENSRVLGQTFCRYFNHYYLDAIYISHVSTYLGKKLDSNFGGIKIERKMDGDTPDFISATTQSDIFLSEAKGRRKVVSFGDEEFDKWRKQFERISVLKEGNEVSLKGYISEFVIANDNNKYRNSELYIEDPRTPGIQLNQDKDMFNLIKCGHYKEILDRLNLGFVGGALLYDKKIPQSGFSLSLPVFQSRINNEKYIGVFWGGENFNEIFPTAFFSPNMAFFHFNEFRQFKLFYGLKTSIFKSLLEISKGKFNSIDDITP